MSACCILTVWSVLLAMHCDAGRLWQAVVNILFFDWVEHAPACNLVVLAAAALLPAPLAVFTATDCVLTEGCCCALCAATAPSSYTCNIICFCIQAFCQIKMPITSWYIPCMVHTRHSLMGVLWPSCDSGQGSCGFMHPYGIVYLRAPQISLCASCVSPLDCRLAFAVHVLLLCASLQDSTVAGLATLPGLGRGSASVLLSSSSILKCGTRPV